MGRESSHGAIREASNGVMRCYLCMASPASHSIQGFDRAFVNVCTFCYNALNPLNQQGVNERDNECTQGISGG